MIHIAFSADEKYVSHMGVAMTSILVNSSESDEFFFHVISDSISERSLSQILSLREIKRFEFQIVDLGKNNRCKIEALKKAARCSHLTAPETYFRLFVGSIFPDIERVLYLDSDVIVLGSLAHLWGTDLGDHTIAIVEEPKGSEPPDLAMDIPHYFNSGVMLFNLGRWRLMGYEERCLGVEDNILEIIQFADQSIINHVFRDGDFVDLGIQYNYIVCLQNYIKKCHFKDTLTFDPVVLHFAGLKPWVAGLDLFNHGNLSPPYSYYWQYRLKSPWKRDPIRGFPRLKNILRYLGRHPKDFFYALTILYRWSRGDYRFEAK